MNKRYHSVIKRVVLWPLVIMLLLSDAVFTVAVLFYNQTKERETDSRIAMMDSGYAQLENIMKQCEYSLARYFSMEVNSGILRDLPETASPKDYLLPEAESIQYLEMLKDAQETVDGILLYFPNISRMNFRGSRQMELKEILSKQLLEQTAVYNHWYLVSAEQTYIVYIMKSGDACCGCWMSADNVLNRLGLQSSDLYTGIVFFEDVFGSNSLQDNNLETVVLEAEDDNSGTGKDGYHVYYTKNTNHAVYMGLVIRSRSFFEQLSLPQRIIFFLAVFGFLATIIVVLWLNHRISRPIMALVDAMDRYGNGEVEYRLEERNARTTDEFDLLGHSLNEMMDKVNELEFNLYETRLREQDIQMKYISQQIRPHFILNALNVIYTYDEEEFPLVKKMVIYLVNYFRYIVNLKKDFVELRYEFRHVENYLNIQKERTQNKIDFYVEWEHSVSDVLIPPLILQTFVENSIKYAVSDNKLYIIIRGYEEDGKLKIVISDTGQGFGEQTLQSIRTFLETREDDGQLGVGIVNTVQRMDILYHGEESLTVGNTESGGACIEICLPLLRNEEPISSDTKEI